MSCDYRAGADGTRSREGADLDQTTARYLLAVSNSVPSPTATTSAATPDPGRRVVRADVDRGVRADDGSRPEAFLVTAPPPTDAEHGPVRKGISCGEFDLQSEQS